MVERPRHEVAEVFEKYLRGQPEGVGPSWSWEQYAVADRILACRTARLGGHIDACGECGYQQISYNSCRNRHCPKCQGSAQAAWLEARQADVLPVPYSHVVFTIPQSLAPLALQNPKVVYDLLLRTVARTLQDVAANPMHLGARLGFFAILHTWGQTLIHHPHVHCVVPAGGLAGDGSWRSCRPGFFLPIRVLSRLFRGKFVAGLRDVFHNGRLEFHGALARHRSPPAFDRLLRQACRTEWVVYAKPPFENPKHVLEYLARYTHRIAISNHRILHVDDEAITFCYKDYRGGQRLRSLTLPLSEFCRRFLLHVLPKGFVRIRHYGFLANAGRVRLLSRCRLALGQPQETAVSCDSDPGAGLGLLPLPHQLRLCPNCGHGSLRCVEALARPPPLPYRWHHVAA